MAGWGGARAGAGKPQGGVSQAKRLLNRALMRGLEIAGREKGLAGTAEEVAVETAGQIAADMCRAGRGDEVLKLLALSEVKSGEGGDKPKSPLLESLGRLPGMLEATQTPQQEPAPEVVPAQSNTYATRATDGQSVARVTRPFFTPQAPLELPPAERAGPGPGEGGHPPLRPLPGDSRPHAENFEKNSGVPL